MTSANFMKLPPLAGIATYEEAARPGYSVGKNLELLRRYNYLKARLVEIAAANICSTPEWEVKCGLSLHIWLDAEHGAGFRRRAAEMRDPSPNMDKCPDQRLETFIDEALRSKDTVELLTAVYTVLRPALVDAYRVHVATTNKLADHPTVRMLRFNLLEEEEMIAWGRAALASLVADESARQRSETWQAHLAHYLAAAGGIMGTDPTPNQPLPAPRATDTFELDLAPKRDGRFPDVRTHGAFVDAVWEDLTRSPHERTWALRWKRLREMDVPEVIAAIIAQTKGKPWDYYVDLTRQTWDEARHAMMGEAAFTAHGVDWTSLPLPITWSYNLSLLPPLERHAHLYAIEQRIMRRDTGKPAEWEVARLSDDELATTFQDYDWADEVLHAQIGRRWVLPEFGDAARVFEVADRLDFSDELWQKRFGDQFISWDPPSPNWWTDFYRRVRERELGPEPPVDNSESL